MCISPGEPWCGVGETLRRHLRIWQRWVLRSHWVRYPAYTGKHRILSLSFEYPWHSLDAHLRNDALHDIIGNIYCFRYEYITLKQTRSLAPRTLWKNTWAADAVHWNLRSARPPKFSIVVSAPVNAPTWRSAEIVLNRFVRRWMSKCSRTNACLESVSTFINFNINLMWHCLL